MANETQIERLRYLQNELRLIRYHTRNFNLMCETLGYTDDTLPSLDDLQSRISQEINWLDV